MNKKLLRIPNCVYRNSKKELLQIPNFTSKASKKVIHDSKARFPAVNDGKWGFIDKSGSFIIEPQFDEVETYLAFNDDLAAVCIGGKWGYINKNGQMVIKPQFTKAGSFFEGRAFVEVENSKVSKGYIDKTGRLINDKLYTYTDYFFSCGLAWVRDDYDSPYKCIDVSGKVVFTLPDTIYSAYNFKNNLAGVSLKPEGNMFNPKLYYFVDCNGRQATKKYYYANDFYDERAQVTTYRELATDWSGDITGISKEKFAIIDTSDHVVIPSGRFNTISEFSEGLAMASTGSRKMLIDKNGKVCATLPSEIATMREPFSEGLASMIWDNDLSDNHEGYIDRDGHVVIGPYLKDTGQFHNGLAHVVFASYDLEDIWGYIDPKGNIVWSNKPLPPALPAFHST